jgi:hypothetical protein
MRVSVVIAGLVAVLGLPSTASAQRVEQTEPSASSPAGVIYAIPLDAGRRDGAPSLPGPAGGRAGAGGSGSPAAGLGGGEGSTIKSENGFGSSSQIPDLASRAVGAAAHRDATGTPGTGPQTGPRTAASATPARLSGNADDAGGPSAFLAFFLVGLTIAFGAYCGLAARRALRRSRD